MRSTLASAVHYARDHLTPVMTGSALEDGQLSADDYVIAGDKLTHECPSWRWERGAVGSMKAYLPSSKQYLVTRGVPCHTRVQALRDAAAAGGERIVYVTGGSGDGGIGGGWVEPLIAGGAGLHLLQPTCGPIDGGDQEGYEDLHHASSGGEAAAPTASHSGVVVAAAASASPVAAFAAPAAAAPLGGDADGDDGDYADLASFVDSSLSLIVDPAALPPPPPKPTQPRHTPLGGGVVGGRGGLRRDRRYDLYVTYDNAYRVPRAWLVGRDEAGGLLPPSAMLEDVSQDHAQQTATLEAGVPHAEAPTPCISIHPCRHAHAMKRIMQGMGEGGEGGRGAVEASAYMFVFLKFLGSIIPGVEYDYTLEVY